MKFSTQESLIAAKRRRDSVGERFREGIGNSSDRMEGGGREKLLCSKSLNLQRAEGACSESGEDSRSMLSSDGWGECVTNPGNGTHLVRSKRSRVVMGARSVGRERRTSLLLERGRSDQGQEPFVCSKSPPEKEPSNRKKFFSWMRRLSGKRENKVEKEAVAGVSPGRGSVVAEVCNTCREVLEERRSSSQLFGSCEMKVMSVLKVVFSPISTRLVGEGSGEEMKQGGEENILARRAPQAEVNLRLELELSLRGIAVEQA